MKARIVNNNSENNIPPRLLKDETYAKEFWEYLCKVNPNENYGDSFDEWYDKLKTLAFTQKINTIDRIGAIKNATKKNK